MRKRYRLKPRFYLIMFTLIGLILMACQAEAKTEYEYNKVEQIETNEAVLFYLSDTDRELVCRTVMSEARGETMQGQMAVAQTILDRATLWNKTIAEVVLAEGQYAPQYQGEISDSVSLAVANVFDHGFKVFDGPVTHFYSGDEVPYWASNKIDRGMIGNQRFLY